MPSRKLTDQPNYTSVNLDSGTSSKRTRMAGGSTQCQFDRNGFAVYTIARAGRTNIVVIQGQRGVIKLKTVGRRWPKLRTRVRSPGDARRPTRIVARGFLDNRGAVGSTRHGGLSNAGPRSRRI
jgi:hypothetical protein